MPNLVTLLISIVFVLASCKTPPPRAPEFDSDTYADAVTEHKFAVTLRIAALCPEGLKLGTAFVVGTHSVYTAKHVVVCGNGNQATLVIGKLHDGRKVNLLVDKVASDHDTAVLKTLTWNSGASGPASFDRFTKLSVERPKIGEEICFVGGAGDPSMFMEKCGKVFESDDKSMGIGMIGLGGNSGGPLFNSAGEVVGVMSQLHMGDTAMYGVPSEHFPKLKMESDQ